MQRYQLVRVLAFAVTMLCAGVTSSVAQDGSNVLVVVNSASPDSDQIGVEYARSRAIPSDQILRIKTEIADQISRERYGADIERPIADWLNSHLAQDRILYIVLTKGVPLRIAGSEGRQGTVASVDSELTLLYRRMAGIQMLPAGTIANPYFLGDRGVKAALPFTHKDFDIYLVARLDGYTVNDVLQLIKRGSAPVRDGVFLLDQKSTLIDRGGDAWLQAAAQALAAEGFKDRVVLDSGRQVLTDRTQVLGYSSWGSNDPAITRRHLNLGFVPGALASTFVSTDARTFKEPPPSWTTGNWEQRTSFFEGSPQSLVGDLIRDGITGVAGNVAEPYLDGTVRPQALYPAYVAGFNLVESFYLAAPYLSWQTTVIGDPLCAPFRTKMLTRDETTPEPDSETELPKFFSARLIAAATAAGRNPQAIKLALQAEARLRRGDQPGATKALEAATALDPKMNNQHLQLATLYAESGEVDKSIERYRQVLVAIPNELRTLNNLAYTLAVTKHQPDQALPLAEKAYKLAKSATPGTVDVRAMASIADTLGWIHHLLGQTEQAEPLLFEASQGAPDNAEIQFDFAVVEAALGRRDEALAALNRAVKLNPALDERSDVKQLRATLTKR